VLFDIGIGPEKQIINQNGKQIILDRQHPGSNLAAEAAMIIGFDKSLVE
jgi:hypothetical protein